jgi:cob(I)alamin adenosyltransferase
LNNGQFQVYTGNGKGKTTAAIGLAVRASGSGLRVFFGQFIKDDAYSEISALRSLPGVTLEQFGTGAGYLVGRSATEEDRACARAGLDRIHEAMASGDYDVVIADEINVACQTGLITEAEWRDCARAKPDDVELVFTGRGAPDCAAVMADLMTEMREIRHYYDEKGLPARKGIEY